MAAKYSPDNITRQKLTPPEVAEIFGVSPDKVLAWIRRGELRAVNLSNGTRPRFAIDLADIEAFESARQVVPTTRTLRRRPHSKLSAGITEYY